MTIYLILAFATDITNNNNVTKWLLHTINYCKCSYVLKLSLSQSYEEGYITMLEIEKLRQIFEHLVKVYKRAENLWYIVM